MAHVIPISGIIGIDVHAKDIRTALNKVGNADVTFDISSPGGFVMPALEIFNLIRLHKGNTTARLIGQAASAAAYIPMAADTIEAFDNAVLLIHNVSAFVLGDRNDLRDAAARFEKLDNLIAKAFENKTGKSRNEILALMDKETILFGEEIKEEGFADKIIETEEDKDKEESVAVTRELVLNCIAQMKKTDECKDDLKQAAAFAGDSDAVEDKRMQAPAKDKQTNKEGKVMDLNKLKAEHPEILEAAMQLGVGKERDRVTAHLILGQETGALDTAIKAVEDGTEMNATMNAKYLAAGMNKRDVTARKGDDADAAGAVSGLEGTEGKDAADKVADVVCEALGYDEKTQGGTI